MTSEKFQIPLFAWKYYLADLTIKLLNHSLHLKFNCNVLSKYYVYFEDTLGMNINLFEKICFIFSDCVVQSNFFWDVRNVSLSYILRVGTVRGKSKVANYLMIVRYNNCVKKWLVPLFWQFSLFLEYKMNFFKWGCSNLK